MHITWSQCTVVDAVLSMVAGGKGLCGLLLAQGRQAGWPVLQFVSRPFVVGDRVELRTSSGSSVVVGLVERISPMSTTIRNDHSIPISIPNK